MNFWTNGYALMLAAAIAITVPFWLRLARRDRRLMVIYLTAFIGAFVGAKLVYWAAEGWRFHGQDSFPRHLAVGKSVLGGLLGGYMTVELVKRVVGYRDPTGDLFATVVPLSLIIGRFGCLKAGCCLGIVSGSTWFAMTDRHGVERWPAVPVEIAFNVVCVLTFYALRKNHALPGQHFHLYLIGYGFFRAAHEFLRDTPRISGLFSGYQVAALLVAGLGVWGFVNRARSREASRKPDCPP